LQEAIDIFCTDDAADAIGKAIGRPNVVYTIEPLLEATSYGPAAKEDIEILLDVLAAYSAATRMDSRVVDSLNKFYYQEYRDKELFDYIESALQIAN
jgi:hypothetical protein